jgi:hypothetical protein
LVPISPQDGTAIVGELCSQIVAVAETDELFGGLCPSRNAGNATDAQMDLRFRGGMLTIKRVVAPLATLWRAWVTASVDQLRENMTPGLTVSKTF